MVVNSSGDGSRCIALRGIAVGSDSILTPFTRTKPSRASVLCADRFNFVYFVLFITFTLAPYNAYASRYSLVAATQLSSLFSLLLPLALLPQVLVSVLAGRFRNAASV